MKQNVQKGDFLFYYTTNKWLHPVESAIEFGEWLVNQDQKRYFYHCAVAISETEKFEANFGELVGTYPIEEDGLFEVVHIPVDESKIDEAIAYIKQFEGQSYNLFADFNDAVRILTNNSINFDEIVESEERRSKICSIVGALFAIKMGLFDMDDEEVDVTTPQDLYIKLKNILVNKVISDGIKNTAETGMKIAEMWKSQYEKWKEENNE